MVLQIERREPGHERARIGVFDFRAETAFRPRVPGGVPDVSGVVDDDSDWFRWTWLAQSVAEAVGSADARRACDLVVGLGGDAAGSDLLQ
jgi:hypothetical protein